MGVWSDQCSGLNTATVSDSPDRRSKRSVLDHLCHLCTFTGGICSRILFKEKLGWHGINDRVIYTFFGYTLINLFIPLIFNKRDDVHLNSMKRQYNKHMQQITPHLWFDKEAKQAAEFYSRVFPDARVTSMKELRNTPSGDCDIVEFQIADQTFMSISAGPIFKFNPSISFIVNFDPAQREDARELIDDVWEQLVDGGKVLMPLGSYPHSERYGWLEDKFGVSWQLMLTNPLGEPRPFIVPNLLFTTMTGKAEEALKFYLTVFKDGKEGAMMQYPKEMAPASEGLMYGEICIMNTWLAAMDGGTVHDFAFNEAVSLLIPSHDQAELDYYMDALSAVPEAEQCGWLKDKYGVSWQVCPTRMAEMMSTGTPEQVDRVTQAFLPMKRFDLAVLERAFKGE